MLAQFKPLLAAVLLGAVAVALPYTPPQLSHGEDFASRDTGVDASAPRDTLSDPGCKEPPCFKRLDGAKVTHVPRHGLFARAPSDEHPAKLHGLAASVARGHPHKALADPACDKPPCVKKDLNEVNPIHDARGHPHKALADPACDKPPCVNKNPTEVNPIHVMNGVLHEGERPTTSTLGSEHDHGQGGGVDVKRGFDNRGQKAPEVPKFNPAKAPSVPKCEHPPCPKPHYEGSEVARDQAQDPGVDGKLHEQRSPEVSEPPTLTPAERGDDGFGPSPWPGFSRGRTGFPGCTHPPCKRHRGEDEKRDEQDQMTRDFEMLGQTTGNLQGRSPRIPSCPECLEAGSTEVEEKNERDGGHSEDGASIAEFLTRAEATSLLPNIAHSKQVAAELAQSYEKTFGRTLATSLVGDDKAEVRGGTFGGPIDRKKIGEELARSYEKEFGHSPGKRDGNAPQV
ncbi:hypothetical protein BDZ90DRAFT_275248 [Jaminaea rosea]|uniref:Uncharacterized protein n=1 Tax=Jaminaea rosea TaxID=1569628 RepID=A0A316UMK1_9BASI|nr:hypothetical protein BDZ90DRAFT_275248 [Jaminaea rosea]PWN26497.1 hypothetical protein BDZ90DRAFT_275248 [Jaminaea rosea]